MKQIVMKMIKYVAIKNCMGRETGLGKKYEKRRER
jgi:hypothetical protein